MEIVRVVWWEFMVWARDGKGDIGVMRCFGFVLNVGNTGKVMVWSGLVCLLWSMLFPPRCHVLQHTTTRESPPYAVAKLATLTLPPNALVA